MLYAARDRLGSESLDLPGTFRQEPCQVRF
jgi:hypothetical protein